MVVCQAQTGMAGDPAGSDGLPGKSVGPGLPYQADEQSPVADLATLSPRSGNANPHVRFDERGVEMEAWWEY